MIKVKSYRFLDFEFFPVDRFERQVLENFMLLFWRKEFAVNQRDSLNLHRQVLQRRYNEKWRLGLHQL